MKNHINILFLTRTKRKGIAGWRDELDISFDIFNEVGIKYKAIPKKYLFTKSQLAGIRTKQLKALSR